MLKQVVYERTQIIILFYIRLRRRRRDTLDRTRGDSMARSYKKIITINTSQLYNARTKPGLLIYTSRSIINNYYNFPL